jgi:hypothetical protein
MWHLRWYNLQARKTRIIVLAFIRPIRHSCDLWLATKVQKQRAGHAPNSTYVRTKNSFKYKHNEYLILNPHLLRIGLYMSISIILYTLLLFFCVSPMATPHENLAPSFSENSPLEESHEYVEDYEEMSASSSCGCFRPGLNLLQIWYT